MVSNTLKMREADVIATLERLRAAHSGDPEYRKLREDLPESWPV